MGNDQVTVNRLTRIYYGGKYFSYPLKAFEALLTLGVFESFKIITSYASVRLFPNRNPKHFAQWVTNKFGKRLFEIFFEAYTEKLWGISCREISADWAAQRIKGLSLLSAVRNALLGNNGLLGVGQVVGVRDLLLFQCNYLASLIKPFDKTIRHNR